MMPQTLRSDTFSSLMCNVDATTHHNWIVAVFWTRPKMARWMESAEKPNVSSLQQCIFLKRQGTVYIPKFIMQLDNWTLNTSWEHGPTVQHYQHVPNSGGVVRATFILERTQLNLDVHPYNCKISGLSIRVSSPKSLGFWLYLLSCEKHVRGWRKSSSNLLWHRSPVGTANLRQRNLRSSREIRRAISSWPGHLDVQLVYLFSSILGLWVPVYSPSSKWSVGEWAASCATKLDGLAPMKGNSLLSYFFEYLKLQSSMYMICYDFSAHLSKDIHSQLFGCSSPAGN